MYLALTTVGSTGDQMRFHRADFHGVLLSHLPPSCTTHNGKRLKSYIQPFKHRSRNSPITLIFRDGSTATCDVLIGADGIKSAVRPCMMRELAEGMAPNQKQSVLSCIDPIWSGVTAYRTLIPAEKLRARCPDHRVFRGGIIQVSLLLVTLHSIDLAAPSFLVLGKRCCEIFHLLYIYYIHRV
jgi:salicylate hydroxylase